ncbi:MAG: hypothetical protein ACRD0U_04925 [Acidimicrobiales bacterium]
MSRVSVRTRLLAVAAATGLFAAASSCGGDDGDGGGRTDIGADQAVVVFDGGETQVAAAVPDPDARANGAVLIRFDDGTFHHLGSDGMLEGPSGTSDLLPGGFLVDDDGGWIVVYGVAASSVADKSVQGVVRLPPEGGPEPILELVSGGELTISDVARDREGSVLVTTRPFDPTNTARSRAPFERETDSPVDVQVLRVETETSGAATAPEVVAGRGRGCTSEPTPAADAQFSDLRGVAVDGASGTIYIADPVCGQVYAIADGSVRPLLQPGEYRPSDVAIVGGRLLMTDWQGRALVQLHPAGGPAEILLSGSADGAAAPTGGDVVNHSDVVLTDPRAISPVDDQRVLVVDGSRVLLVGLG